MSDNTILNEDQVELVVNTLKDNLNEKDKVLREIKESDSEMNEDKDFGISDSIIIDRSSDLEIEVPELNEEQMAHFKKENDLSDEEALKLFTIINRYKNKEKFNLFNELPESLRKKIKEQAAMLGITDRSTINSFTKVMIESLINEAAIDSEYESLMGKISEEVSSIPSVDKLINIGDYLDSTLDSYYTKALESYESLKDTNPKSAEIMRDAAYGFNDAYTLQPLVDFLNDESNIAFIKKMRKHIIRIKRFVLDFDSLLSETFKTSDKTIMEIEPKLYSILKRKYDNSVPLTDIHCLIVLLCKVTYKMEAGPRRTAFMHFTLQIADMVEVTVKTGNTSDSVDSYVKSLITAYKLFISKYDVSRDV